MYRKEMVAILVLVLAACGQPASDAVSVVELSSPAASGSEAPNFTRDPDGRVYLSWIEPAGSGNRLAFSQLGEEGWSAAGKIAEGENWFVNWADFPSMLALGEGRLAAHWLVRSGPGTYAYDVHVGLSMNDGESWQSLGPIHDDGTETEHGFVALYPYFSEDGSAWPGLIWLDGRNMAGGDGGHGGHADQDKASGMTLRHARIRPDGGRDEELELDALTCDCCQTAAASTNDAVLIAYRDRSEEEIRDIRLQRRGPAGWSDQGYLFPDGWEIAGCPVNGPSLDAQGDRVAVAWFTAADGRPVVKAGMSRDAGRSFDFYELEAGQVVGRVDVALTPTGAAVSWLGGDDNAGKIRLQLFGPGGSPAGEPLAIAASDLRRSSGFPRLVAAGDDLLLAWTDVSQEPSQVRTIRIRPRR